MNAAYSNERVKTDGRAVHVEFDVRNDSGEAWRAADGFGVGHHLFDADSGTLLVDGARVHPGCDIAPGESMHVALDLELPPEAGHYQVRFSPMRENVCWYYDKGWDFLAIDAHVHESVAQFGRLRVTDREKVRRERELRAVGRAFVYPVLSIWRNRSLIRVMVRRDILGRYRGSFAGSCWTFINPLLLMLTYFFVFGVVIRDPALSRSEFALYFLAGMLPWLPFSEAAGRAPGVVLEHRNFVKKLVFAVETLPVNLVFAGLVTELFAVILYCGFLLAIRHTIPLTILWLPVVIVPQVLFTMGISWFLAGLGAFVRDLGQIIGFLLTVWFFITPICYPERQLLVRFPFMTKNPIYVLVHAYREIFLANRPPAFDPLWKLSLLAILVFVLGHAWFYKLRKSFADMI
ncbi:MAG TPA: ABC transporter permease [Bryobacteraceae bacterium]|nr:ABC transporter permease [Bryobacteraceae bacterium]